jgi:hypothetical protein
MFLPHQLDISIFPIITFSALAVNLFFHGKDASHALNICKPMELVNGIAPLLKPPPMIFNEVVISHFLLFTNVLLNSGYFK